MTDFTSWSFLRGTFFSWKSEYKTIANDFPFSSTMIDFILASQSFSFSGEGTRHLSPGCHMSVIMKKKTKFTNLVYKVTPHINTLPK